MRISVLLEEWFNSILLENYQLALKDFSADNDVETVKAALEKFKRLQPRISDPAEKDINFWRKKDFTVFVNFLDALEHKTSKRKRTRDIKAASDDILTVKKTEDTHLFFPLSKEASCFYGSGTPWCISTRDGSNYFYTYTVKQKLAVCFLIHDNAIYAMVFRPEEFQIVEVQDVNNRNDVKTDRFFNMAGITKEQLHQFTLKNHDVIFGSIEGASKNENAAKIKQLIYDATLKIREILDADGVDSFMASPVIDKLLEIKNLSPTNYLDIMQKHFEHLLSQDARLSYFYANYILKGRFEKGEDAIATDAHFSNLYAVTVLKSRFIKGEPTIFSDEEFALEYIRKIIRWNRIPEYEEIIAKSKILSAYYASFSYENKQALRELGVKI